MGKTDIVNLVAKIENLSNKGPLELNFPCKYADKYGI